MRDLTGLHATPKLLLGGDQNGEIERVHRDGDYDPFAAAGDDREHRTLQVGDPHIMLELRHVLLGRGLFRERPRQHEFGLEYRSATLDDAVEGSSHPRNGRMLHVSLDVGDVPPAGVGVATIRLFEAGKGEQRRSTLSVIRQALEAAGVEFTNGDQPGVRLRKRRWSKARRG
jgi:hypothetical protein